MDTRHTSRFSVSSSGIPLRKESDAKRDRACTADASLYNPSHITVIVSRAFIFLSRKLELTDVSLQTNEVVFGLEFMSQIIGSVNIGDLLLIPEENLLGTSGTCSRSPLRGTRTRRLWLTRVLGT